MKNVLLIIAGLLVIVSPLSAVTGRAQLVRTLAEVNVLGGFIGSECVTVLSAGKSALSQQIPLVVVRDPEVPVEDTRRVFIICRQHGDEPAPTEALLSLILTQFSNPSEADLQLLRKVTLVIVPMMNPDGARKLDRRNGNKADLNRDWTRQRQPETRAVLNAIKIWQPFLVLDEHELDRDDHRGDYIQSIGYRSGAPSTVKSAVAELRGLVTANLKTKGLPAATVNDAASASVRLAHQYIPLRLGLPALLVESRQSGWRAKAMSERVKMHLTCVMTAVRYAAGDTDSLRQEIAEWRYGRSLLPTYRGGQRRPSSRAK